MGNILPSPAQRRIGRRENSPCWEELSEEIVNNSTPPLAWCTADILYTGPGNPHHILRLLRSVHSPSTSTGWCSLRDVPRGNRGQDISVTSDHEGVQGTHPFYRWEQWGLEITRYLPTATWKFHFMHLLTAVPGVDSYGPATNKTKTQTRTEREENPLSNWKPSAVYQVVLFWS